ncbi:phosphatase PAP2 family protein [Streptomyces bambusae]|uniref:Phosphatase PAP2 family protein n=1 Tax=Streptomyces bambusae TaxID=1550616 RepID=A0ABS6ZAF7_9ACTN|nr:phosphatase PAP2 family protein [Streptomyces bambusae]MBW5484718.1 phosphatase PAP2 family protein [Streptomyces bambusae]
MPSRPVRRSRSRSRFRLLVCVLCALLGAVLTAAVAVEARPVVRADAVVAQALHAHAAGHPAVVSVNRLFTDWVWDPWTMRALAAAAAGWLAWRGELALAVRCVAAVVAATLVSQGVKALLERERPWWPDPVDSADYAAYPSGHALTAAAVFVFLLWLVPRSRAAWVAAAVSVAGVGFTRLYLGVHWMSDVVGGWLLGAAVALCALAGAHRSWAVSARPQPGRAPSSPGAGQQGS